MIDDCGGAPKTRKLAALSDAAANATHTPENSNASIKRATGDRGEAVSGIDSRNAGSLTSAVLVNEVETPCRSTPRLA